MKEKKLKEGLKAFDRQDYVEAMELLSPFAHAGNAQAQCNVAAMFHCGLGVAVNGKEAVKWYKKAAEQEDEEKRISALACNNLATLYITGVPGVLPNQKLASRYRQKAIELGFKMGDIGK